jgi:hypothetical protein
VPTTTRNSLGHQTPTRHSRRITATSLAFRVRFRRDAALL